MTTLSNVLPGNEYIENLEVKDVNRIKSTRALSGKLHTIVTGQQVFELRLRYANQPSEHLAPIRAFITQQRGGTKTFYVKIEQPNLTDRMAAGNFVNIEGQPGGKLYMIIDHANQQYAPTLPTGATVSSGDAYMNGSLKGKGITTKVDEQGLDGFSLTIEERL